MKIKQLGLILALLLFTSPFPVSAATIFIDDTFSDTTKIDLAKTTAEVDTTNGWVTLGEKDLANSVLLYRDSYDITVINGSNIETYQFDGTGMSKNSGLSVSGLTNPLSVSSYTDGEYLVVDQGTQTAIYYNFDGSAMVANPYLSVSGLTNPLSVGIVKDNYNYAVLDSQEVKYYSFDGSGMVLNNYMSANLGADSNPVSISINNDGFDYAVVDKANSQVKYYSFDGSAMSLNPLMSITAAGDLTKPRSVSLGTETGTYAVVDNNSVKTYNFDGTTMVQNTILSTVGLNKPVAVAIKPDSYDYAVLQDDASGHLMVSYYAINGINMEEIAGLRVTGLDEITFGNDQLLMGKEVTSATGVSGLRVVADVELPAGTSIAWEVTVDGVTWLAATNNGTAVRFATAGTKPKYRALLHTDNPLFTPKILSVQIMDGSLWIGAFRITNIVGPVIPDNPVLPSSVWPIKVWAGYNVGFEIDTTGDAASVVATISVDGNSIVLSSIAGTITCLNPGSAANTWQGVFHTVVDVSYGILLDIAFTTAKETEYETVFYEGFAEIYGSALEHHPIHLTH